MLTALDYARNGRTAQPRTYQWSIVGDGNFLPFPHHMIGFSNPLGDHNVNFCNTDVSLFVRISIFYVRHSLPPPGLFCVLTILGQRHGSSQRTLPTSNRTASEPDDTSTTYSSMDEKTFGTPHEPTVGPVGEHVDTGAEK